MAVLTNTDVFGLESSIYRSGYPMMDHAPNEDEFRSNVEKIAACIKDNDYSNAHIKRAIKLAGCDGGHDQFLTGIIVNFDMCISNKAWVEAERYTFLNFISSMSCMHRASVLPIAKCCNSMVSNEIICEVANLQSAYNAIDEAEHPADKKRAYLRLLYNIPSGFELTAGMTTNYRCIKNIYQQRLNHRLPDWKFVCDWIEGLPMADELIIRKERF